MAVSFNAGWVGPPGHTPGKAVQDGMPESVSHLVSVEEQWPREVKGAFSSCPLLSGKVNTQPRPGWVPPEEERGEQCGCSLGARWPGSKWNPRSGILQMQGNVCVDTTVRLSVCTRVPMRLYSLLLTGKETLPGNSQGLDLTARSSGGRAWRERQQPADTSQAYLEGH